MPDTLHRADLVVRHGSVVDGTGAPRFPADVAVTSGKVVAVGQLEDVEAREELDASGLVVSPGFIDLHSHGDLILAWPSEQRLVLLEGRLAQGITTEIVGNCGLGAAPLFGDGPSLLPEINGWMSPERFAWSWRGLGDYFSHLERVGLPLNVGALVPHGPIRLGAMGLISGEPQTASLSTMESELDAALDAGAFGLSAGLIYPPGMYTATDELVFLARRVSRTGGLFTCHVRGSSETLLLAVGELLDIGRRAEVHVHHSHAEAVGQSHWEKLESFLEDEEAARREGLRVSFDMFPYAVAATMMLAIYPPWSLEGGLPQLLERLRDPAVRKRIQQDIDTIAPAWPPWQEGGWPHNLVRAVGWDRILISTVGSQDNREAEGLSLEELGRRKGTSPFDAISDLMIEENGNVGQFVLDISGEDGLERLISHPQCAFITDANDYGKGRPHPAAYGSFPRILGHYVRERSLLGLEDAVRRMTSLPAGILGLPDRGRLRPGAWADMAIFDPARVIDRATLSEPRLKPEGIEAVFVNGDLVWRDGAPAGRLPGRILRRS